LNFGWRQVEQLVDREFDRMWDRVVQVVSMGTIGDVDNAPGVQLVPVKIDADDAADEGTVYTPPGISSRPAAGAEAIVLAVGGNPSNLFVLPIVRGQRLTGDDLAEGEVALFIGVAGQRVQLKLDGSVEVRAADEAGGSVLLKANGDVVVTPGAGGKVLLDGDGAAKKVATVDDLNTLRSAFNAHTHPTAPVGPVSTPTVVPAVIPVPTLLGADNTFVKG